jgi:spermidine synthase
MIKSLSTQFPFSLSNLKNKESIVLYIAMLIMGACGLAYEYTLSKIASDILGNSVKQWAVIIGIMMFFMGIGSDLQKHFKDKYIVDWFIFFEILLGLLGAFGPISLLFSYGVLPEHYIIIQYFFIIGIGLIIGFEIPLITRINEAYISELRFNLGAVLKMDYIGALCGSLLWVFILPKFFTIVESAFVLGLLNISIGAVTLFFFRKLITFKKRMVTFFLAVSILILIGFTQAKNWTAYSEQNLFRDRIIFSETTQYQHIVFTQSNSGDVSCFINGHLQFNSADEYIYHENLVHPAFAVAESRRNILILGGGDGLALREVLKYKDVKKVTLCDIDPKMTKLAKHNSILSQLNKNSLKNSRVTVLKNNVLQPAEKHKLYIENQNIYTEKKFETVAEIDIINLDASKFIEQISGIYDIIVIDFPDPNSLDLAKLYADQFYINLRKKLSAFGIIVQQSTSPIHAKEVFLAIGRTMRNSGFSAAPYHDNVPSFGEWGWWIAAKADKISEQTIVHRLKTLGTIPVETSYLTPELVNSSLFFGKNQLNSETKTINTITNNLIYDLYLNSWQN